jgi:hypothetical protein
MKILLALCLAGSLATLPGGTDRKGPQQSKVTPQTGDLASQIIAEASRALTARPAPTAETPAEMLVRKEAERKALLGLKPTPYTAFEGAFSVTLPPGFGPVRLKRMGDATAGQETIMYLSDGPESGVAIGSRVIPATVLSQAPSLDVLFDQFRVGASKSGVQGLTLTRTTFKGSAAAVGYATMKDASSKDVQVRVLTVLNKTQFYAIGYWRYDRARLDSSEANALFSSFTPLN